MPEIKGTYKTILEFLIEQSAPMKYPEIRKKSGLSISPGGTYTAMERLAKDGLVEKTGENEYSITSAGREAFKATKAGQKSSSTLMTHKDAEITAPPEKPAPAKTEQKQKEKTPVTSPLPNATEREREGPTVETSSNEPEEDDEGPTVSMTALGTTPYQIFMNLGALAGVQRDRIKLTANMVWAGGADCYNLDWVWKKMGECAIPYDLRSMWIHAWKAYSAQERQELSSWEPPSSAQIKAAEERERIDAKKEHEHGAEKSEPKEFLIGSNNKIVKVGVGAGMYTFPEAQGIVALDNMKIEAEAAAKAAESGGGREKFSDILTALAPYITGNKNAGEGGQDKISDIITALAPFMNKESDRETMANIVEAKVRDALGGLGGGEQKPWYETLPAMVSALSGLAPTIRTLLGVPDTGQLLQMIESRLPKSDGGTQAFQLLDSAGNPMRLDLNSILEIKKFEREQAREDESHKNKMEMASGIKDFLGKISGAAQKMAGK
jgi:DNA-binding PadR family transcriptional regulator